MTVDSGVRWDGTRAGARRPGGGRGPSRRTVVVALLAAAALAAVTGSMVGLLRPAPSALTTALTTASAGKVTRSVARSGDPAAPSSTSATAASAPASGTPSGSASPSPKPTPSPAAAPLVAQPWMDKGLDFVKVTGVRRDGELIVLRVDRLQFLTGDAAQKYYDAHPDLPRLDYAVVNASPKLFTYTLVPNAPIYGSQVLTGNPEPSPIDAATLFSATNQALANKQAVHLWLRHQDGGRGWTTYAAEQYLP